MPQLNGQETSPGRGGAGTLNARLALAYGLPTALFFEVWPWMAGRWFGDNSYWGHGPFVPLVALLWIWGLRRAGRLAVGGSPLPALPLALVGALGLFLIRWRELGFAGGAGWWFATAALLVAGGGLALLRSLAGPHLFLAFMIPAPLAWVEKLTFELKFFAMRGALWLLRLFGSEAEAVGTGSRIRLSSGEGLIVGEVCSGLRSAVTLVAIGYLVAAFVRGGLPRRALVFAAAIPAALLANVLRIALLIAVADGGGADRVAPGTLVHDGSGFLVYALAAGTLLLLSRLVGVRRDAEPTLTAAPLSAPPRVAWSIVSTAVLLAVMAGGSVLWSGGGPRPTTVDFAALLPASVEGLPGADVELTPGTRALLRADQVVFRRYGRNGLISVCLVHGTSSGTRIHAPEVCYRGDGFEIAAQATRACPLTEKEFPEELREILIERGRERWLVWYWFFAAGRATASYGAFERAALWQPGAGQGLFRFAVAVDGTGLEAARERMNRFLRALQPSLGKILTRL